MLAWLSVCMWPSWYHCHSLSLASVKSRLFFPFWYWLTRVVLDKGPLNGCRFLLPTMLLLTETSVLELGIRRWTSPQKCYLHCPNAVPFTDISWVDLLLSHWLLQVWPHGEYPLIPVGRMVLNRNPKNYFAEVEQSAFCPAHMVPGIEPSPDKMLQVTQMLCHCCCHLRLTSGVSNACWIFPIIYSGPGDMSQMVEHLAAHCLTLSQVRTRCYR